MIPFYFTSPKILPLCVKYLRAVCSDSPYFTGLPQSSPPLECVVCATSSTEFVISDKFHSISCDFSHRSLLEFKRAKESAKMESLAGCYLAIHQCFPSLAIEGETISDIRLVVTSFSLMSVETYHTENVSRPPPVIQAEELEKWVRVVANRNARGHIASGLVNTMPELESMLKEPEKAVCSVPMVLEGAGESGASSLKEIVRAGMSEMLDKDDRIVECANLPEEEARIEAEAQKLKTEEQKTNPHAENSSLSGSEEPSKDVDEAEPKPAERMETETAPPQKESTMKELPKIEVTASQLARFSRWKMQTAGVPMNNEGVMEVLRGANYKDRFSVFPRGKRRAVPAVLRSRKRRAREDKDDGDDDS